MRSATKATLVTAGVIVSVLVVLGVGVLVLEAVGFLMLSYVPSYYYHLEYNNMHFTESDGAVSGVSMGSAGLHDWRLPAVYAKFPQRPGEVYFLPKLKEELVQQLALRETKQEYGRKIETNYTVVASDGAFCQISFYDGHPAGLYLSGPTGIRISPTTDGEYMEFPTKRRDVIRVFGRPLNIERREAQRMVH